MATQSNNLFATCVILLLFLFLILETSEAARFLDNKQEGIIWKGKENLLLPSLQWRPVRPPRSNSGTNSPTDVTSQISERNFAGRKEVAHPAPGHKEVAISMATH